MTRPRVAAPLIVAASLAAACSPRLPTLPTGPAASVSDMEAVAAVAQATADCSTIRTLTAEIGVRGSANGRGLRGQLLAGVEAPGSVRLEAVAPFGQPLFIFVATGADATLLLPRDERVLEHGRPADVLEAVAGIPLDAADLATTLTGCASSAAIPSPSGSAKKYGETWLVVGAGDRSMLYLRREGMQPWQLMAAVRATERGRQWRADYADRSGAVPRSIRVTSVDETGGAGAAFDLRLGLSQVEINTPLDPAAFAVRIPPAALPITIEELRESGPMAPSSNAR
jgi:hypothetical protein